MNATRNTFSPAAGRRGSVFVLLVAMLTVVALLVVTLTYTSQVEATAARNLTEGIQARVSAVVGIPRLSSIQGAEAKAASVVDDDQTREEGEAAKLDREPVLVRLGLDEVLAEQEYFRTGVLRLDAPSAADERSRDLEDSELIEKGAARATRLASPLAKNVLSDESAKININAFIASEIEELPAAALARTPALEDALERAPLPHLTAAQFAAFIDATLKRKGISSGASGAEIAAAILARRYGQDGKPGAGGSDDNADGGNGGGAGDGLDNDQDRAADNAEEEAYSTETDGLDNNRDGRIDEPGESVADDGLDNNFDGQIDGSDEGMDDPAEFCADPRLPPHGDDRPYTRLDDLLLIRGMTAEALEALEPYLTVFSVSRAAYLEKDDANSGPPQLDPNTAAPRDIYRALTERFPDLPAEAIGQYVANLADRRDPDDVPSELELGPGNEKYVGFEITPAISEVCPDVATFDEDGDDGQFIEIANPHSESLDLTGWRIEGGQTVVRLSGTLPAGGLLVITDDYNESTDESPEEEAGFGSLYDIFKVVPTGPDRRIEVEPGFDLPNASGAVRLYNPKSVLIDTFEYAGGTFSGAAVSFQRPDPRLRSAVQKYATPLAPYADSGAAASEDDGADASEEFLKLAESLHNQPFLSPLELMFVPTTFRQAAGGAGAEGTLAWKFPGFAGEATANLDLRLLDIFLPGAPAKRETRLVAATRIEERRERGSGRLRGPEASSRRSVEEIAEDAKVGAGELDPAAQAWRDQLAAAPALVGRINLNTAPPAVLAALPGMDETFVFRLASLRAEWAGPAAIKNLENPGRSTVRQTDLDAAKRAAAWDRAVSPEARPRWTSFSDFLTDEDLWQDDQGLEERLARVYPFSRLVTFHSLALRVESENLAAAPEEGTRRRATKIGAARILAADRGRIETVTFRYGPSRMYAGADGNLEYGEPEGANPAVKDLAKEVIRAAERTPEQAPRVP